jgi:hypothetical protein
MHAAKLPVPEMHRMSHSQLMKPYLTCVAALLQLMKLQKKQQAAAAAKGSAS